MQQPLSPIQKIDEVLRFIASKNGPDSDGPYFYKSAISICTEIQRIDPSTEVSEFIMVMQKLLKDGRIGCEQDVSELFTSQWRNLHFYKTFEGSLFIESGGYHQQELDRKANTLRIQLENSRNRLNQILLVIGAIGAAVGAVALVAWEIYKYFCLEHL
jgi:hypothetical protein